MKTKNITNKWTCRFALAGISLMGLSAFGQDMESMNTGATAPTEPGPAAAGEQGGRLPMTATVGFAEQFNTKIDDNNGVNNASFSISRFNVGLKAPVSLGNGYQLANSFRYGSDYYNFNGVSPRPWRDINTLQAASVLAKRLDETWTVYGGGFLKLSSASDVALGKGATAGLLAGFNYKVNDTLNLGAGLGVASQLQDKALIVPLITARWQFADDWSLNAGLTDVATTGYGAEAKWHFNDAWDFGFGVQYHNSRFRIESPDGSGGDGVGQEKAAAIYADATWHATPKVDLNGFAGFTGGGNLKIYNNSRTEIAEPNYKTAAILGVKASVRF